MNKNTNWWGVETGSTATNEAVQRIAFSFGYRWQNNTSTPSQSVEYTFAKFLVFDPTEKTILYALRREDAEISASKLVLTFDQAIELFHNPPKNNLRIGSVEVMTSGDVRVAESITIDSATFDKVVVARRKFLKSEEKEAGKLVPEVRFVYKSPSTGRRDRTVLILEDKEDRIEGLDVDNNHKYKVFLKSNMDGRMIFRKMAEAKEGKPTAS